MKNKKANLTLYLTFIISCTVIILVASVFAPMGVVMNTKAYAIGEQLMLMGNDTVQDISDTEIREDIEEYIDDSMENTEYTIELNSNIFQYSWILIIVLTALVLFLFQRRLVELGGGRLL